MVSSNCDVPLLRPFACVTHSLGCLPNQRNQRIGLHLKISGGKSVNLTTARDIQDNIRENVGLCLFCQLIS